MLKQATRTLDPNRFADAAVSASRQLWLAGLGAASVTRRWASNDASAFFRTLVKQGEVAESHAKRVFNKEMETSVSRATRLWKSTRHAVAATVNTLAQTAAAAMPSVRVASTKRKPKAVKKAVKRVRAQARRAVSGKRVAKRSARTA